MQPRKNYSSTFSSLSNEDETETRRRQKEEREALGWTLDAAARGSILMGTAVFVSSELLRLAKIAAGCDVASQDDEEYEPCDNRVLGMKPTSLLTNIMAVVGLISAFLMPLIGMILSPKA